MTSLANGTIQRNVSIVLAVHNNIVIHKRGFQLHVKTNKNYRVQPIQDPSIVADQDEYASCKKEFLYA